MYVELRGVLWVYWQRRLCMKTTRCTWCRMLIWLCGNADSLQLRICPIIPLHREETIACKNSLQLTLKRQIAFFPPFSKSSIFLAQISRASSCVMLDGSCCMIRHISSVSGGGCGGGGGCEDAVLPTAVLHCTASPILSIMDQKRPRMSSSI